MEKDKSYQKLLGKMLRIERLGDILYKSLASKVKKENLKLTYERLAKNEQETARNIENEILALDKDHPILVNSVIINLAKLICGILTARQLTWILKTILKRRMYSKWCNIYSDKNKEFWHLLLDHEKLQHELLSPLWDN
jgi:hypothetical protein